MTLEAVAEEFGYDRLTIANWLNLHRLDWGQLQQEARRRFHENR
jgi:hypothetical protein